MATITIKMLELQYSYGQVGREVAYRARYDEFKLSDGTDIPVSTEVEFIDFIPIEFDRTSPIRVDFKIIRNFPSPNDQVVISLYIVFSASVMADMFIAFMTDVIPRIGTVLVTPNITERVLPLIP
jgi:hypothetical protein